MKAINTIVERKIWNEKPVFGADLVTWSRCHTVRWFLIDSHPGKLVPVSYPWRCAVNNNNWRTARSFSARVAYEEHCLPLWNTFVSRKVIATCRLCCVHNHAQPCGGEIVLFDSILIHRNSMEFNFSFISFYYHNWDNARLIDSRVKENFLIRIER